MPWATDVGKMTTSGDGYAIFTTFDLVSGSLYSISAIDATNSVTVLNVQDVQLQFATSDNTAANVISIVTDNSITIETPQRSKIVDGVDGTEKAASAAAGIESIVVTLNDTSKGTLAILKAAKASGKVVALTVGLGKNPSGVSYGPARIMGKITGGFTRQTQGNTTSTIQVTISGGTTYDKGSVVFGTYNTAVGTTVTPVGEDAALTIPGVTEGEYTTLCGGDILLA